jgi:hypothetical protein
MNERFKKPEELKGQVNGITQMGNIVPAFANREK